MCIRDSSKPVPPGGSMQGVLQVARSLVEYDASLDTLRRILAGGSLLATLTTFGLGWVLAGASLRPIDRITLTAQAIGSEHDFGRRVQYNGPDDEVGRLTKTFNTMLGELQAAYQQMEGTLLTQRRFVADASHELRTPLTTIRGNIGLLEREPPISTEDRVAVLADTVEECDRLIRLVNNLLEMCIRDSIYTGRTRHFHVKVQAPSQPILTTQLYFPNEPANERDGIFDEALLMEVEDTTDGKLGKFNFVLSIG